MSVFCSAGGAMAGMSGTVGGGGVGALMNTIL